VRVRGCEEGAVQGEESLVCWWAGEWEVQRQVGDEERGCDDDGVVGGR
jgi:hypothetical protein